MERYQELMHLQHHWKPPVELAASTPREVELSAAGKLVVAVALAMVIGAVASVIGLSRVANRQAEESRAIAGGAETDAVVTRHWRSSGEDSTRRIAYEFVHQGVKYQRRIQTPRAIWNRLAAGSTIRVRFAPDRPELNHPAEWESRNMPWFVPGGVGALLVASAALLVWILRRQLALLENGRPAAAVVTEHKRGQHGKSVVYEFPLLGGGVGKGKGGESRKPPAVGTTLTVIYDRENPKHNAIYPVSMVRVVR